MESTQKEEFWRNGYIHLKNFFSQQETNIIAQNVTMLHDLPETPYKWMKYYESGNNEQLSRIENFYNYSELSFINLIESRVKPVAQNLFGTKLNLFKDNLNWKLPGGGAFTPHQDHLAWKDFAPNRYINVMLFIDPMTQENGCLEVASEQTDQLCYDLKPDGSLPESITNNIEWTPLIGTQRDLLIFDSYIPHQSGPNNSDKSRRAMFLTYNDVKYGDLYNEYFTKKRSEFPPPIEREPDKVYQSSIYNLANPIG